MFANIVAYFLSKFTYFFIYLCSYLDEKKILPHFMTISQNLVRHMSRKHGSGKSKNTLVLFLPSNLSLDKDNVRESSFNLDYVYENRKFTVMCVLRSVVSISEHM